MGQPQTRQPPPVVGIKGFAGEFRLGIYPFGAVHRAGADAHNDTFVIFQQFTQLNIVEKAVLGGNMTAGKDDQIAVSNQIFCLMGILAVQNPIGTERNTCFRKGHEHMRAEMAGQLVIIRTGCDEQTSGTGRKIGFQSGKKTVGGIQDSPICTVNTGAAGDVEDHIVPS